MEINSDDLIFNKIPEYTSNLHYEYNIIENENEENKSMIIKNDKNNNFSLQKKFSFKFDLEFEDWV